MAKKKPKKPKKAEELWVIGIHPHCNADNVVHPCEGGGQYVVRQGEPIVVPASVGKELCKQTYYGQPLLCRLADEED